MLARRSDKENWQIICGDKVCSAKQFKTAKEAIRYINSKPYEIIMVMAIMMAEIAIKNTKDTVKRNTKKEM